jgi:hypothetical protein
MSMLGGAATTYGNTAVSHMCCVSVVYFPVCLIFLCSCALLVGLLSQEIIG